VSAEIAVLYEHPEWQKPLFAALERRGVPFTAVDLKRAAFEPGTRPPAPLVFNQASPSAYVRGNTRAVPFALAYLKALEHEGATVVNGARAFALELSKTAQAAMIRKLGLRTPRSITFNDVDALASVLKTTSWTWPALVKPEQGGSGARIEKVSSLDEIRALLDARPELWMPDGLFLLQEYVESDVERGIVRMELLGGELLYAMRVVAHGRFNLCPSEVCNPVDGSGEASACEVPAEAAAPPVEFYAYAEIPAAAVDAGRRIAAAAGIDIGGIEYLEAKNGELVFYDVNANSNLRPAIANEFGFDPFDRVVDYLLKRSRTKR
jgi:glutathione synthase/RimK-type ligase-like ATP-grasp enzyme